MSHAALISHHFFLFVFLQHFYLHSVLTCLAFSHVYDPSQVFSQDPVMIKSVVINSNSIENKNVNTNTDICYMVINWMI